MNSYDVILPAGGTIPSDFARVVGTDRKALIQIGGATVVGSTLSALRGTGRVRRIALIGPKEVLDHESSSGADLRVEEGLTGPENLYKGLDALLVGPEAPKRVLIITSDLPFVTSALINTFIDSCPPKDFCVPLVNEASFNKRFPGTPATFVALKDDVWTTGCIYLADVVALRNARPHIERVFEQRKSKLGMAKLLGLGFVLKYLTKQMRLADVEKKITDLLHCSGAAVPGSAPEFAFDIDYLEDYQYAVNHLASQDPADAAL